MGHYNLEGEVALVTGASRGIGHAILHELAKAGAVAVGTATSDSGAATIGENLHKSGLKGTGMALDVTHADQINEVVKAITDQYGAPTVVVNNAGINRDNLLMRMKDDDWD